MYVVLKTVNGQITLVVGPFALKGDALSYTVLAADTICPAGEKWLVRRVEAPAFGLEEPACGTMGST